MSATVPSRAAAPAPRPTLRIAVVTETYPPEVNGVAMTLARFVDGLRQRHHDVQLVRPRQHADDVAQQGDHLDEVLVPGLPIPRYAHLKMGLPATRALCRLWTQQRPDLVHLVTEGPLGWSALRAARKLGLPVSSDFRTNFDAYSAHYGFGCLRAPIEAYLRHFHNRTLLTLVPTEAMRSRLGARGFQRLQVVARGVDTELFHPERRSDALRSRWGAGAQTQVVLFVGRLAPEKNLDTLVAAYQAMQQAQPDSRLVLVGDGPAREALQQQCPHAVFTGQRTGTDLAAHYASADVFLFPSITETWGNVTAEAMASGLVVLAYDCAAAGQLIRSGENGVLAPLYDAQSGDTHAFIRRAVRLATVRDDTRAMRQSARHTAAEWGWDRVVDQFEAALLHTARSARCGATPAHADLPDELDASTCSDVILPRFGS
ncbi:MAG: glycoside hydrolase [Methylibium sp. NZG]|nr:MAG: glycoside hydrolase [Methylibium sp. NZG]